MARYTISILSDDSDLILYIESKKRKGGFSGYIRELIRKDMENLEDTKLEHIYEYVIRRINEEGFFVKELGSEKVIDLIEEADKDIIKDLF